LEELNVDGNVMLTCLIDTESETVCWINMAYERLVVGFCEDANEPSCYIKCDCAHDKLRK
jgi:hypothetical protein